VPPLRPKTILTTPVYGTIVGQACLHLIRSRTIAEVQMVTINSPMESFDYYCSRVVAVGKLYDSTKTVRRESQSNYARGKSACDDAALALRKTVLHAIEHGDEPRLRLRFIPPRASTSHARSMQAHLKTMSRLNISLDLLTYMGISDSGAGLSGSVRLPCCVNVIY